MKVNGKLILIMLTVAAIGLCCLSYFGIGSNHLLGVGNIKQGLDLMGGVAITYQAGIPEPTREEMDSAVSLIQRRLDRHNWTEAEVGMQGSNRIRVEIPGVEDAEATVAEIGRTAMLYFATEGTDEETGETTLTPFMTGSNVINATRQQETAAQGVAAQIVVALEFDDNGRQIFEDMTGQQVGKPIYIMLDEEIISAPVVSEKITGGNCTIQGNFDMASAEELASLIREGALPFELEVINLSNVGARLGAHALQTSMIAGGIGIALVLLFMAFVYKAPGLAADLALALYIGLLLIILSLFGLTLTLPGIAGIILSIGMAVDANVIIFERMKEELISGRSIRAALDSAYKRAFPAILDGNVTTLIAALVLLIFGTGPIQGFAQTLGIGIVLSMFTALVITRTILASMISNGLTDPKLYGSERRGWSKLLSVISSKKRNFAISLAVIAVGIIFMIVNAVSGRGVFNYDVVFSGGTAISINIGQEFNNNDISAIITEVTGQDAPQVQRVTNTYEVAIKMMSVEQETRVALLDAIKERYSIGDDAILSVDDVSATVSSEMQTTALKAVALACIAMLIYVSIRFKDIRMGSSAIAALLHDALIMLTAYAVLRIPVNYSFIAAILTILGYSINATIVVFDRIRENRANNTRRPDYAELVDKSITQTLTRSIYTTLTTLLTIVALYISGVIFSVGSITEFALPIMVGLIAGTFSSVFISGALWFIFTVGVKKAFDKQ